MLNLCSLCFEVPEFVVLPCPRHSENNSRRLQKYLSWTSADSKVDMGFHLGANNFCSICALTSQNLCSLPLSILPKTIRGQQKYLPPTSLTSLSLHFKKNSKVTYHRVLFKKKIKVLPWVEGSQKIQNYFSTCVLKIKKFGFLVILS